MRTVGPTEEEITEAKGRYETGDADALDLLILVVAEKITWDDVKRYSDDHGWVSI